MESAKDLVRIVGFEGKCWKKWLIYGCSTDLSPDDRDPTRTSGMPSIACGWPADTPLRPPAVQRKHPRIHQDNIGMHQDVARTPQMGIRTLRRLTDGVYRSYFSLGMSAGRLQNFISITLQASPWEVVTTGYLDANGYKRGWGPAH